VATPAIGDEHVGWQGAGVEAIIELVERFGGNGFTLGRDTSFTCYHLLPLLLADGCHGVVLTRSARAIARLESPFASAFTISSRIASEQYLAL
jgi:hypothetical protein